MMSVSVYAQIYKSDKQHDSFVFYFALILISSNTNTW